MSVLVSMGPLMAGSPMSPVEEMTMSLVAIFDIFLSILTKLNGTCRF